MKRIQSSTKGKNLKKVLIGVGLTVMLAGGIWYLLSDDIEVRCVELAPVDYVDTFTETGRVKRGESINYVSEVDGNVLSVNVTTNAAIKKGDLIAVIDSSDLEYEKQICSAEIAALEASKKEIAQETLASRNDIQAAIDEANYELQEIESQKKLSTYTESMTVSPEIYVNSLRIARNQAETNRKYFSQLVDSLKKDINDMKATVSDGDVSLLDEESSKMLKELEEKLKEAQKEYKNAKEEEKNADAAYEDAVNRMNDGALNDGYYATIQSDFEIQLQKIQASKAALEKKLKNDPSNAAALRVENEIAAKLAQLAQLDKKIDACKVVAQYDGVVSELPAENMSRIAAGEVVATVRTEDNFTVEAEVLTNSVPYLAVGDSVRLVQKLKSEQQEYPGEILAIYDFAEKTVSALGNDEYRVKVIVGLQDAGNLKDGYEVDAVFNVYRQEAALIVPNSALFKQNDRYYVFAVKNGKARMTPVEVLHRGGTSSAIGDGLTVGDVVVIDANTDDLVDGSSVAPEIE